MSAIGRITRPMRTALFAVAVAMLLPASPAKSMPSDTDIFIGTLEREGGNIILRRCDLAENRYVLIDAPGGDAMASVRKSALPAYGEVLASYAEQGGRSILKVDSIADLTPGKNCHLLDAMDHMFKKTGAAAATPDALRTQLAGFMIAAGKKSRAADYAGAVAAFRKAQAFIVTNRNMLTTFQDLMDFADIAAAHGDALKSGRLGDPCLQYALARTEGLRAIGASDGVSELREMARATLDRIDRKSMDAACPARVAEPPDPALAGHYYLSGVRETGSELLLDANGTFQWFLSYGAVDQTAQGQWHREGDTVVLAAAMPATDKPLFAFLETEPWSAQAEEELRRRKHDEQVAAVRAACPFLTDTWVSTPAPAMMDGEQAKPAAAVLRHEAASARVRAIDLRARVESLARQVMGMGAPQVSTESADEAQKLLSEWMDAKEQAQQAARTAGLPDPALGDPTLPATCTTPPIEEVARDAPSTWRGGLGARVFDREGEQGARDVHIRLRFADGHEEEVVTAGRGLALPPGKPAKAIVGATLHADYAKGRDASFAFVPVTKGILHFSIDAKQLAEPPFVTLRLKITGKALVPEAFGKGRYERQP